MLGFLSTEGKFHECINGWHIVTADNILKGTYNISCNNTVDTLCKLGWVAIQSGFIGFTGDDIMMSPELTNSQKDWLESHRDKFNLYQTEALDRCLEADKLIHG